MRRHQLKGTAITNCGSFSMLEDPTTIQRLAAILEFHVSYSMKGPLGTLELKRQLKAALNPHQSSSSAYGMGDKVMHLRNNYQKEVFKGRF